VGTCLCSDESGNSPGGGKKYLTGKGGNAVGENEQGTQKVSGALLKEKTGGMFPRAQGGRDL